MKNRFLFPITCIILLSYSCNKSGIKGPMSISEVFTYTNQANTKCTEKLKNENTKITFSGFINRSTIDTANNCFDVFESPDPTISKRIQVLMIEKKEDLFAIISKTLNKVRENDFIKIKIRGTITGKALYTNGGCIMGTFITISDLDSINF